MKGSLTYKSRNNIKACIKSWLSSHAIFELTLFFILWCVCVTPVRWTACGRRMLDQRSTVKEKKPSDEILSQLSWCLNWSVTVCGGPRRSIYGIVTADPNAFGEVTVFHLGPSRCNRVVSHQEWLTQFLPHAAQHTITHAIGTTSSKITAHTGDLISVLHLHDYVYSV